tara:strand:- start:2967 stop:3842 length:876 start_codon:yes stop_codon:yes gene_type:complete
MSIKNKEIGGRLVRLFSSSTFRSLSSPTAPTVMRSIVAESGATGLGRRMRLRLLFDQAYDRLMDSYRSEYFYKNAIVNQILLQKHTLDGGARSARLLTEFWAGEARVDIGIVNGTSTAYEIKTELDTLDRLSNQLHWYSKVFDRVYVVVANKNWPSIAKVLPRHVGLITMSPDGRLLERLGAASNKANIDLRVLFRAMREMEVLDICHRRFGVDYATPNGLRLDECWRVFKTLDHEEAHDLMVEVLRRRAIHPAQSALIESAPSSLKVHAIGMVMNVRQYRMALNQLDAVA